MVFLWAANKVYCLLPASGIVSPRAQGEETKAKQSLCGIVRFSHHFPRGPPMLDCGVNSTSNGYFEWRRALNRAILCIRTGNVHLKNAHYKHSRERRIAVHPSSHQRAESLLFLLSV